MLNKKLYKYELWLAKSIPIIISAVFLLDSFISYYYIDQFVFSSLFGVAVLPLLFVYISSFAFGFKLSNRVFIYFIVICWVLDIIDYYIGIPLSETALIILKISMAGLTVFAAIVCTVKERNHVQKQHKKGDIERCLEAKTKIYKYELLIIKIIPMVLTGICILNSSLSFFFIDWPILSFVGGTSLIMILFMYLSSAVFKFCFLHRIFIHFLAITLIINISDYYLDYSRQYKEWILIAYNVIGIALFATIVFKKTRRNEFY